MLAHQTGMFTSDIFKYKRTTDLTIVETIANQVFNCNEYVFRRTKIDQLAKLYASFHSDPIPVNKHFLDSVWKKIEEKEISDDFQT